MENQNRNWIWIIAAVIILLSIVFIFGGSGGYDQDSDAGYGMMNMMYGNNGYVLMFLGWITWILIVVLLIAAISWFMRNKNQEEIKNKRIVRR